MKTNWTVIVIVALAAGILGGVFGQLIFPHEEPGSPPPGFGTVETGRIHLYDSDNRVRLEAWAQQEGAYLQLNDPSIGDLRRPSISLASWEQATVEFYDRNGMLRLSLGMAKDGEPFVRMFDGEGKRVWTAR